MIGCGEALDKVAGPPGDDPNLWFQFLVGDRGENEGKHFATVSGKDAARGSVHRQAPFLSPSLSHVSEFAGLTFTDEGK